MPGFCHYIFDRLPPYIGDYYCWPVRTEIFFFFFFTKSKCFLVITERLKGIQMSVHVVVLVDEQ